MNTEARGLHRSRRNKMVFGVAGGLAERYHIDPAIIRIAFILLAFANGIGVVLYLLLTVFLPKDEATGQPLQTLGRNVRTMPQEANEAAHRVLEILRGKPDQPGTGPGSRPPTEI